MFIFFILEVFITKTLNKLDQIKKKGIIHLPSKQTQNALWFWNVVFSFSQPVRTVLSQLGISVQMIIKIHFY